MRPPSQFLCSISKSGGVESVSCAQLLQNDFSVAKKHMVPALMRQFAEKCYKSLTNEWVAHHVTNYTPSKTSKEGVSKAHETENSPSYGKVKVFTHML